MLLNSVCFVRYVFFFFYYYYYDYTFPLRFITAGVFWLVISMLCMCCRFVLLFLKAVLWWGLCKWSCFFPRLRRLLVALTSSSSSVLPVVSCTRNEREKKRIDVFSLEKETYFYSFNVRSWQNKTYFLQHAFWTMVLKICLF